MNDLSFLALVALHALGAASCSTGSDEGWAAVPPGKYLGYCESYHVENGKYQIDTCDALGGQCDFQVTKELVHRNDWDFHWDHPGLQASRIAEDGIQRIIFRGRVANLIVADLQSIGPDGEVDGLIRMVASPAESAGRPESR